ncbi:MAG: hypothetical protein J2P32_18405, partial [Actinobacteria bacterium]|nr:hypothetical protein [Actinomycetota bacterium]
VTDNDTATVDAVRAPGINVVKNAQPPTYGAVGEVIHYSYLVTNSGNTTLTNIVLTDTRATNVACPSTTLAAGAEMECRATTTITAADIDNGHLTNVAHVTGQPPTGPPVTDNDTATVDAVHAPGINVVKTPSPRTFARPGQQITYTYRVTNTGNVTLTGITLTDSRLGPITCPHTSLPAGEHMDCTATHTTTAADVAAGHITNVARVTGQPPTGPPVTGEDKARVIVTPTPPSPTPTPPSASPTPSPTKTFVPGVGLTGGGGPLGGSPAAALGALALALIALAGAGRLAVRRLRRNGTLPRRE